MVESSLQATSCRAYLSSGGPQEGSSVEPLQQGGLTCLAVLLGLEADAI